MTGHLRYGRELEGSYKGRTTLVLLSARHHDLASVRQALDEHGKTADHLWVQCAGEAETLDWNKLGELAAVGFVLTVQVRDAADLPPAGLPWRHRLSLVWVVPAHYRMVAAACEWATVLWDGPEFVGQEASLAWRAFDPRRYKEDESWECQCS